jgi:hypothetical protein
MAGESKLRSCPPNHSQPNAISYVDARVDHIKIGNFSQINQRKNILVAVPFFRSYPAFFSLLVSSTFCTMFPFFGD